MECTQVVDWDAEEKETEISSGSLGYSVEPIGRLHLFSSTHGPERDFPLYHGKNVIGRSPDCSVALPFPSISKQHAVIEISAWNKAPILQDCGSLNGTQIVRPPRVLTPGMSHRLRDQELILFADFLCQYHRLVVSPPLVPQRLLTVEEISKMQGGSQTSTILLAEDSQEEVDFPSGRCVANGSRNTTSPLVTVVPESDEEGSSPAPNVPRLSLPFDLGRDTDEEQGQQPGVGETEQPETDGMAAAIQPTVQNFKDIKIKKEADDGVVLVRSILERIPILGEDNDTEVDEDHQCSGFVDSDTDVEEERIPVTPPAVSMKKKPVLGVDTRVPGAPGVAEEEEEVSAVLTLAHLKEKGIALWSRGASVEEVKFQPQILVERSQSASGRDSNTDVEEGISGGRREIVSDSPMDIDEALIFTHPESQPSQRPSDVDGDVDMSSPGSHLEGNHAPSAMEDKNGAQLEEVPPGPSVTLGEKHQVPPEKAWEITMEEGSSSAVADVRKSQQPVAEDTGTACTAAVSQSALEVGAQSRSAAAPVEQLVVDTDTSGDPTLPQTPTGREREAHVDETKNAKHCCDESEDLCLPATQCFVKKESQNPDAVQSLEDEPTQLFPYTLPQEPGPSRLSLQIPGPGTLDAPWEVLATQPFCLREQTEASQPQLIATHLELHGSHPTLPRAPPGQQHLLRIEGTEIQTMEKAMGHLSCQMTPAGKASKNEAAKRSELIPKPQPKASRVRKKPPTTTGSPLRKCLQTQVPEKTTVFKEEDSAEAVVKEEPQEIAIPIPGKRKRDHAEDETQGNLSRSRRTKPHQETVVPKVLFTGVVDSRGERAVLVLGGSLANSVNDASYLVTDRIRRTVKFLCAVGKGIPILSLKWLYQSQKAGYFLPPDDYLVTDPEQEKNFSFNLRDSLSRARERRLLEGYEIHVTPGVQPPPPQMAEIIRCCGGIVLPGMPRSYKPHRVVVTCTKDLPRCAIPSGLGLPLLSPEFLLTGVLKQEATPEAFILSKLKTSST